MSMGYYPQYAYILPATIQNLVALQADLGGELEQSKLFDALLAENTKEIEVAIEEFLGEENRGGNCIKCTIEGKEILLDIIYISTDDYTDLDVGTYYLGFSESDLFVKTPTEVMTALKKLKKEPRMESWVVFG